MNEDLNVNKSAIQRIGRITTQAEIRARTVTSLECWEEPKEGHYVSILSLLFSLCSSGIPMLSFEAMVPQNYLRRKPQKDGIKSILLPYITAIKEGSIPVIFNQCAARIFKTCNT